MSRIRFTCYAYAIPLILIGYNSALADKIDIQNIYPGETVRDAQIELKTICYPSQNDSRVNICIVSDDSIFRLVHTSNITPDVITDVTLTFCSKDPIGVVADDVANTYGVSLSKKIDSGSGKYQTSFGGHFIISLDQKNPGDMNGRSPDRCPPGHRYYLTVGDNNPKQQDAEEPERLKNQVAPAAGSTPKF